MEFAGIDANNHITTAPFAYDAAGNETADAAGIYTWNAEGELKTAGGVILHKDWRTQKPRRTRMTGTVIASKNPTANFTGTAAGR